MNDTQKQEELKRLQEKQDRGEQLSPDEQNKLNELNKTQEPGSGNQTTRKNTSSDQQFNG